MVLHFCFSALVFALTYARASFGWSYLGGVLLVSIGVTLTCVLILEPRLSRVRKRYHTAKLTWVVAALAFVALIDIGVIMARQGWSFDDQNTYFRPPMHNDLQRHTLLVNALARKSGSPFLPQSEFLYQLFWHHLASPVISVLPEGVTRYYQVLGAVWFSGFIFYFMFLWFLALLRPGWFLRPLGAAILVCLVALHADLFGMLNAFLTTGVPGIEADWSYNQFMHLRYFTPKIIAMTAPQHAAFFMVFLLLLASGRIWRRQAMPFRLGIEAVLFVLCFLISPLMSAFTFLPYGCARLIRSCWRERISLLFEALPLAGVSFALFKLFYGFWPQELFQRPGTSSIQFILRDLLVWTHLPFLAFASGGFLGLFLLIRLRSRHIFQRHLIFPILAVLPFGLLFNFLITDVEIRRHYAMVFCFASILLVAAILPRFKKMQTVYSRPIGLALCMGIFLHGYFIYSYTLKPSVVDPAYPWKDYFAMKEAMRTQFPGITFIGVSDPLGIGIEYAVPMEVATGFSMPPHAVIHTRITPEKFRLLQRIFKTGDVAPYAEQLGYEAILWGPVEEKVWGERVKKRFIRSDRLLAKTGTVELYRLSDSLHEKFDHDSDPNDPNFYLRVSKAFAKERWFEEARGFYLQAVKLDPKVADARDFAEDPEYNPGTISNSPLTTQ